MFNWYKNTQPLKTAQSQEYVGADAVLPQDANWMATTRPYVDAQGLPATMTQNQHGLDHVGLPKKYKRKEVCDKCKRSLESFEFLGFPTNVAGELEEAYRCKNCGYTNHFSMHISRIRKRRSGHKKRASLNLIQTAATQSESLIQIAATPAVSPTTPNIGNTPYGRDDLGEDQRMWPWSIVEPDYEGEYETQKQKNNKKKKVVKVKGKDGKIKFVEVNEQTTGGDSISPANVKNIKGRRRNQGRYKGDPWPQTKNPTPDQGWYQAPYSPNTFDADGRLRSDDWYSHSVDRALGRGLTQPF